MNIKEAYDVMGVSSSTPDDEIKNVYKKLAKTYHPDIYKEDPNKFKKINEAYQLIQDYRANPDKFNPPSSPFGSGGNGFGNMGFDFGEMFVNMHRGNWAASPQQEHHQQIHNFPQININLDISFKESVLGVDKEIKYKKNIKCEKCQGKGTESVSNGCKNCNGFGRVVSNSGGMFYSQTCTKCYGRNIKFVNCDKCVKGVNEVETNITVHIPPGNNQTLRMRGAGHFNGSTIMGDAYSDVFLHLNIEKDPDLMLIENDVVCRIKIPLLDALTGSERDVRTIYDTRTIKIPALSKNGDEIVIEGCGRKDRDGKQMVILNVEYPENTDVLIKALKKKGK